MHSDYRNTLYSLFVCLVSGGVLLCLYVLLSVGPLLSPSLTSMSRVRSFTVPNCLLGLRHSRSY